MSATRKWPRRLRRGPMEMLAVTLIALGFLMLFQPFLLELYSYSFVTLLAGTVMFIIVSKFPE
jgi:hypothetical protein